MVTKPYSKENTDRYEFGLQILLAVGDIPQSKNCLLGILGLLTQRFTTRALLRSYRMDRREYTRKCEIKIGLFSRCRRENYVYIIIKRTHSSVSFQPVTSRRSVRTWMAQCRERKSPETSYIYVRNYNSPALHVRSFAKKKQKNKNLQRNHLDVLEFAINRVII